MTAIDIPFDFGFRDEHALLRDEIRRFLAERCPIAEVRRSIELRDGFDPGLWKEIGELGWIGLALPERWGGAGLGQLPLAIALEETGRALLPAPLLASVLAGFALLEAGSDAQRERWLPALARGETIATLAFCEPDGAFEPGDVRGRADRAEGGWVLRGLKPHVPAGGQASLVIAPFREPDGALSLFAVELPREGVTIEEEVCIDLTRRTARLAFEGVRVGPEARLEGDGARALEGVLVRAWGALAAEMVGGAEATLVLTRDYAIERKQFGRSIGSFQAVKHPLVDTMVGVELARTLALAAAAAVDDGSEQAETAARMAKALAGDVFATAGRRGIQFHGGYGFTWECDAHLYLRRALWSRAMLGDGTHHRRRLAAALAGEA